MSLFILAEEPDFDDGRRGHGKFEFRILVGRRNGCRRTVVNRQPHCQQIGIGDEGIVVQLSLNEGTKYAFQLAPRVVAKTNGGRGARGRVFGYFDRIVESENRHGERRVCTRRNPPFGLVGANLCLYIVYKTLKFQYI
jgi:hypothetical protein